MAREGRAIGGTRLHIYYTQYNINFLESSGHSKPLFAYSAFQEKLFRFLIIADILVHKYTDNPLSDT
jgi:hypothetical protein